MDLLPKKSLETPNKRTHRQLSSGIVHQRVKADEKPKIKKVQKLTKRPNDINLVYFSERKKELTVLII